MCESAFSHAPVQQCKCNSHNVWPPKTSGLLHRHVCSASVRICILSLKRCHIRRSILLRKKKCIENAFLRAERVEVTMKLARLEMR